MPGKKASRLDVRAPEALAPSHDLSRFESGERSLDEWLRRRALKNEPAGASRSYVACLGNSNQVVGYYCLAAGAVACTEAPGRVRRNMPDPIPVLVLGRLAVDRHYHKHGIGRGLLGDAILRSLEAAKVIGVRALLVHAISTAARQFYEHWGFRPSPISPMTLMITIAEVERIVSAKERGKG